MRVKGSGDPRDSTVRKSVHEGKTLLMHVLGSWTPYLAIPGPPSGCRGSETKAVDLLPREGWGLLIYEAVRSATSCPAPILAPNHKKCHLIAEVSHPKAPNIHKYWSNPRLAFDFLFSWKATFECWKKKKSAQPSLIIYIPTWLILSRLSSLLSLLSSSLQHSSTVMVLETLSAFEVRAAPLT